jgi:hypothetical protein
MIPLHVFYPDTSRPLFFPSFTPVFLVLWIMFNGLDDTDTYLTHWRGGVIFATKMFTTTHTTFRGRLPRWM